MAMAVETRQVNWDNPWDIAASSIEKCIGSRDVLSASGEGAYANGSWARDFRTAGIGLLEIGSDQSIDLVEHLLDFYLNQSPDIPYRAMKYNHMLFQVGIKIRNNKTETLIPLFKRLFNHAALVGENPRVADTFLILDLAADFCTSTNVDQTRREEFWHRHEADIGLFLTEFTKPSSQFMSANGLVKESPLTSRADCLYKSGNVLLTNIYWYSTLTKLSEAAKVMQNPAWASRFHDMAQNVHQRINQVFWKEKRGHYLDWVEKDGTAHNQLDSLGNSWAIILGIADEYQGARIICNMHDKVYDQKSGLVATVDQEYEHGLFEWILRVIDGTAWFNSGDRGVFWPEMIFAYAAALQKMGCHEMATTVLRSGEELLIEHGTLHETYDANRQPIRASRKILGRIPYTYRSPKSFAMALGLYLWVKSNWDQLCPAS